MIYRPVPVTEFAAIYQFGPSHMHWAARNSHTAHKEKGLEATPSAQALESFLFRNKAHIQKRAETLASENRPANPVLVKADRKTDVTYSEFVKSIRKETVLYDEDTKRGQAARRMLNSPLGMPIPAVTHVERVEQEALLKNIVHQIKTKYAEELKTLELESHFKLLEKQVAEFVEAMSIDSHKRRLPTRTELEEERKELQAEMVGCIFRILGAYPGVDEDDMEMRSALLAPFAIQNDRIGEYNRSQRGGGQLPPEVDEDTGELIDETDALTPSEDNEPTPA